MLKMKNGRGRAWIMLVVLAALAPMFAGCFVNRGLDGRRGRARHILHR